MASPQRRPTDGTTQPAGVEGEGLDPCPTYRDGPVPPHRTTSAKPTDVNLPRARRTYAWPIAIGLALFALIILIRLLWGSFQAVESTPEAMSPGDPATPAVTAPSAEEPLDAATGASEAEGTLDEDVQLQTGAGPGEVGAEPGPADVPGGATTTPVEPAPQ
jgi:hypothetical protein